MNMINKSMTKLKALLYSRTESGKVTINQAIAHAVVIKTDVLEDAKDVRMTIKHIVNEIAELAIMDRVALEKAIVNMYMFTHIKDSIKVGSLRTDYPYDFESAIMLSELISSSTREYVNDNMRLFNTISELVVDVMTEIIDD